MFQKLLDMINLKALEGDRSQLTVLVGALLNFATQIGWIHLADKDLQTVNRGYVFRER